MSEFIYGNEVNVLDGESITLELQRLDSDVMVQGLKSPSAHYTSAEQLRLSGSDVTLANIAKRLTRGATLELISDKVSNGGYSYTLPAPKFTTESDGVLEGVLFAHKSMDANRVFFTFKTGNLTAACELYTYIQSTPTSWRFNFSPVLNKNRGSTAAAYTNLISNIWAPGTYFFSSAEIANFTDKPTGFSGSAYIDVENKDNVSTGDRHYTFRANFTPPQVYTRVVQASSNGGWYRYTLTAV